METKRQLIPLFAIRALFVFAQVYVAMCLLDQALLAERQLATAEPFDHPFYEGKIASARYYARNILPQAFVIAELIREEDDTVLTCPEESLVVR